MGKSSIHLQTAKAGTILHNARENYSKSVVFLDEKNEIWNDSKTAFKLFREELEIRSNAYTQRTKQKLQKNTSTMISGVVNLEQHHTLKDMEKIKDELEKEFDTKVIQMSVHRDEGKLVNKKNEDLKLVSGKDFFLNSKDNQLYFDSKFTKKINMEEWKIEKNYHGHFEMLGIDSNGNSLRKKMNIYKLSQLQDFTAETLKMERTPSNVIVNEKGEVKRKTTTNKKRLDTHEFKASKKRENEVTIIAKKEIVKEANQIVEEAKQIIKKKNETIRTQNETIIKQKEDKKKLKEELKQLKEQTIKTREELKEINAIREDYAKLEALNKQLQIELKNKSVNLTEAMQQIEDLKEQLFHPNFKTVSGKKVLNKDAVDYLVETNQELEKRIQELEKDLNQEHSISTPSYQQKILFEKYQHLIKADLKGYYIDTKGEETRIQNKAKDINITDKGTALISHSNGTQNLQERVKIMLDLSEAKGWDLDKITIKGNDLFKNEIKRQIQERLLLKELHSYKTNLNALQEQNNSLVSENITLNAKVVSSSNIEDLKEKNKELEKYLNASLTVINAKNKELNRKEGKEVYPTDIKASYLEPVVNANEKRLNNESFENLNKSLNKFVGTKSTRETNYGREV